MTIAAALLLALAQDPSTPEKTAEGFLRLLMALENGGESAWWRETGAQVEKALAPLRTDELNAEIRDRRARTAAATATKILDATYRLTADAPAADGSVTVTAKVALSLQGTVMKAEGDRFELVPGQKHDQVVAARLVLERSGASWLVRELRAACWSCSGSGACRKCAGMPAGPCKACTNGRCKSCSGDGYRADVARLHVWVRYPVGDMVERAPDLSSPAAAGREYADAVRRALTIAGRRDREYSERNIASYRPFLAPAAIKALEAKLAADIEKEKARHAKETLAAACVEEKDGEALVQLAGEDKHPTYRILLAKRGAAWRLSFEAAACRLCKTTGKCGTCSGTGKAADKACSACADPGACIGCRGGWREWTAPGF